MNNASWFLKVAKYARLEYTLEDDRWCGAGVSLSAAYGKHDEEYIETIETRKHWPFQGITDMCTNLGIDKKEFYIK